jgi:hypothetical protein
MGLIDDATAATSNDDNVCCHVTTKDDGMAGGDGA